jgi:hypothetical protein
MSEDQLEPQYQQEIDDCFGRLAERLYRVLCGNLPRDPGQARDLVRRPSREPPNNGGSCARAPTRT